MRLHSLFAVALILGSAPCQAAPTYEVTFRGEAPVLVQLDDTGRAWMGSKTQVLDVPVFTVRLESLNTRGSALYVTAYVARPVLLKTMNYGTEALIPLKTVKTPEVGGVVAVSKSLRVPNPDCLDACRALVSVRRYNQL